MAIAALASMGGSLLSSVGGSAAASGMAGSAMSFLGGSSAGLSNSGLLSMGGSLISGLANMFSGDAEAKAQKKAQEERWRQQLINTREQYRQLGQQEQHANKEFHSQLIQNQVSLLQQKAQVELMAGATGTGGGSVSAMLADLTNQAGQNQSKIIDNFENQQQSFINQAKAIQMGGGKERIGYNLHGTSGSFQIPQQLGVCSILWRNCTSSLNVHRKVYSLK